MPLQQTSGAASYDAFGGGAPVAAKYIEDFFQTWLRTGTGSSATVTTGLNGAINKTMVWTKSRSAATNHKLTDNVRGATKALSSNTTGAEVTDSQGLTAFSSTGYTIGTNTDYNNSGATYVDWQFVATPKFFDVVTGTCDGSGNITVNHSLGSVPGFVTIKRTDGVSAWQAYHTSLGNNQYVFLNATNAAATLTGIWNATSTTFTANAGFAAGAQVVLYLWASNAGGFGLTGTDNVISCGSYTGNSTSGVAITLGYEPQWLLIKRTDSTGNWTLIDTMRGMPVGSNDNAFWANTTNAELSGQAGNPTATGFYLDGSWSDVNAPGGSYIYIAIRRGPMRTPTTGTSVFSTLNRTGTGTTTSVTGIGLTPDLLFTKNRINSGLGRWDWQDRLRGPDRNLFSDGTDAEYSNSSNPSLTAFGMDGVTFGNDQWNGYTNYNNSNTYINYFLRRAPGFFDEVCYNGNSSTQTITHNLAAVPELMIVKIRNGVSGWPVYSSALGNTKFVRLNTTSAESVDNVWANTSPTSSSFTVGNNGDVNQSGGTYVAYLFASCPGVSKVGSYTGNGSSQTINMGFTSGARFFLVKRANSTGDWWVYDSARGIVSAADPALRLNSTAAEVTSADAVDTDSTGLIVNQESTCNINVNGATYIYLGIS